ncbi:MAG TPA: hypothetical protein VKF35_07050, partial [Hyphomicrobiaceae bacterium]|nr:hypothetical protein [Hyphomicrobiaceae bacterium]
MRARKGPDRNKAEFGTHVQTRKIVDLLRAGPHAVGASAGIVPSRKQSFRLRCDERAAELEPVKPKDRLNRRG